MGDPLQNAGFQSFPKSRAQKAKPGCFYAFIPSGAHASALGRAYGEVGVREAGVKLISWVADHRSPTPSSRTWATLPSA